MFINNEQVQKINARRARAHRRAGWAFDPGTLGGLLTIKVSSGDHTVVVTR
jgi:hypothetical protein